MSYKNISKNLILEIHQFALNVRKEREFGQRRINREIKKKFNINISENTVSGWIHKKLIPFANEKTQFKPKPIPPRKVLYNLYITQKLSASTIAKKFRVSTIIVINWLNKYNVKTRTHTESMNTYKIKEELANLRLKRPTKKHENLSSEKSYILGVLCGDGYIDKKVIRLEIRKDEEFIKEFSECIEKVYGLKYEYKYYKKRNTFVLAISNMTMCKDLNKYGNFRTKTWNVPLEILNSNKEVMAKFLKGFYDSEGSVTKYSISLASINKKGILEISRLLKRLNIKSKVKNYNYPTILIGRRENIMLFKEGVGFTIKRKQERLEGMYKYEPNRIYTEGEYR